MLLQEKLISMHSIIDLMIFASLVVILMYCRNLNKVLSDRNDEITGLKAVLGVHKGKLNLIKMLIADTDENVNISNYLLSKKISNIGIYGLDIIGELIVKEIDKKRIKIHFIIDRREELQGGRYERIPVISADLLEKYREVQIIIIAPVHDRNNIEKDLKAISSNSAVAGINEILNEMADTESNK